jgi:hypothetical protein
VLITEHEALQDAEGENRLIWELQSANPWRNTVRHKTAVRSDSLETLRLAHFNLGVLQIFINLKARPCAYSLPYLAAWQLAPRMLLTGQVIAMAIFELPGPLTSNCGIKCGSVICPHRLKKNPNTSGIARIWAQIRTWNPRIGGAGVPVTQLRRCSVKQIAVIDITKVKQRHCYGGRYSWTELHTARTLSQLLHFGDMVLWILAEQTRTQLYWQNNWRE